MTDSDIVAYGFLALVVMQGALLYLRAWKEAAAGFAFLLVFVMVVAGSDLGAPP